MKKKGIHRKKKKKIEPNVSLGLLGTLDAILKLGNANYKKQSKKK
ncbi:hypothetical protein ACFSSG_12465 [Euzebyella marina]|nr:hypothetical protein [Euzebyella marina]|tara:strand:- start:191 stop:325 length:135 start_codon:yes stop_codon:yes gene_type:complete